MDGNATAAAYAGFWRRLGAYLVDTLVLMAIGFGCGFVIGLVGRLAVGPAFDPHAPGAVALVYLVVIIAAITYFVVLESGPRQATLGKRALRIMVTDLSGRRISVGQAFGRYFGKYISGLILCIGFLMCAWTDRAQCLHDKMAGTLVVQGRIEA